MWIQEKESVNQMIITIYKQIYILIFCFPIGEKKGTVTDGATL